MIAHKVEKGQPIWQKRGIYVRAIGSQRFLMVCFLWKNLKSISVYFEKIFFNDFYVNSLRLSDAYILTIIGSDNGLAPGWRQTIIWTNDGILLIGPLGTNFSEILIGIQTISFKKKHLKMSSVKWRPFCIGLNVLKIKKKFTGFFFCVDITW